MNVAGAGVRSVKLSSERHSDGKKLTLGEWVGGRLLLIALGFYDFGLFSRIRHHNGFFISRMKDNANPLIVEERGGGKTLEGLLPRPRISVI